MISITCYGHMAVARKLVLAAMAGKAAVPGALDKAALLVLRSAKQKAPVDTGHLRTAIAASHPSSDEADVTSHAEYSIYQEVGTCKMAAHPYMRPALEENAEQIKEIVGHNVMMAVQGAGL